MKRVVYVGMKALKGDNVAKTGLTWKRGEILEVEDEKAAKLFEHADIWRNADEKYELLDPAEVKAPVPSVSITVPGAKFDIPQSAEVVSMIARGEMVAVFMTPADEKAFDEWKKLDTDHEPKGLQPAVAKKNGKGAQPEL